MSLALVDDFFSRPVVLVWRKFPKYIEEVRAVSQRDTYAEYVQWLAGQFEKRESKTRQSRPISPFAIGRNKEGWARSELAVLGDPDRCRADVLGVSGHAVRDRLCQ